VEEKMSYRVWTYTVALAAVLVAAPAARAETPADTLVVAHAIDDTISLDPAEAYEYVLYYRLVTK
jgi:peptide/nickel transport system substrate-binding protein